MRTKRLLMVFSVLLFAALACNLPVGQNSNQPNLAGTITAQALLLQTPSNTTAPASTATPALPEASITAAPTYNPPPPVPTTKPTKIPSSSAPNPPKGVSCTLNAVPPHKVGNLWIITWSFTVTLSWKGNSNNENGFFVYKNGVLLSTLGGNATSYIDKFTVNQIPIPATDYAVSSFNNYGSSVIIDMPIGGCKGI